MGIVMAARGHDRLVLGPDAQERRLAQGGEPVHPHIDRVQKPGAGLLIEQGEDHGLLHPVLGRAEMGQDEQAPAPLRLQGKGVDRADCDVGRRIAAEPLRDVAQGSDLRARGLPVRQGEIRHHLLQKVGIGEVRGAGDRNADFDLGPCRGSEGEDQETEGAEDGHGRRSREAALTSRNRITQDPPGPQQPRCWAEPESVAEIGNA
jgi:hypothetical protein